MAYKLLNNVCRLTAVGTRSVSPLPRQYRTRVGISSCLAGALSFNIIFEGFMGSSEVCIVSTEAGLVRGGPSSGFVIKGWYHIERDERDFRRSPAEEENRLYS